MSLCTPQSILSPGWVLSSSRGSVAKPQGYWLHFFFTLKKIFLRLTMACMTMPPGYGAHNLLSRLGLFLLTPGPSFIRELAGSRPAHSAEREVDPIPHCVPQPSVTLFTPGSHISRHKINLSSGEREEQKDKNGERESSIHKQR